MAIKSLLVVQIFYTPEPHGQGRGKLYPYKTLVESPDFTFHVMGYQTWRVLLKLTGLHLEMPTPKQATLIGFCRELAAQML